MRVVLYANTRFPSEPDLPAWESSLNIFEWLACEEWHVPSTNICRLQNQTSDAFLKWMETFRPSATSHEILLLYFASHQLRDGTILFPRGPRLPGAQFVRMINRISGNRPLVLLNDSCFAEKIEWCGDFSSQVFRFHGCRVRERSSEVGLTNGSPAAMDLFRAERKLLEYQLGEAVDSASFFSLLWLRASREIIEENKDRVTLRMIGQRIERARTQFAERVLRPHIAHPVVYPSDGDVELFRIPASDGSGR
jgi:hypothetical protein